MKRFSLSLLLLILAGLNSGGCRDKETMAPIVLGETVRNRANAGEQDFGPPWQESAVLRLPNHGQLVWLSEEGRERMDLRLMIPLPSAKEGKISAAAIEVVFAVLEKQLRFRGRTASLRLTRNDRPGRIEFAFHGRADQLRHALFLIGQSFAASPNAELLSETQGQFVAAWVDNPVDHSIAAQVSKLLGISKRSLYGTRGDFAKLDRKSLQKAWKLLTRANRSTLVVHSHAPNEESQRSLEALAQRWSDKKSDGPQPLQRLFQPSARTQAANSEAPSLRQTPIQLAPSKVLSPTGRITWLASRRLHLPDAKSRAFARLAQRTLQHQFDVRLTIHNKEAIWQIRCDLSPEADIASDELRYYLGSLDQALHERLFHDRVHQAARTWLGARLVENSLKGEDWSVLWSESLDLSSKRSEIPLAMQRNGEQMMKAQLKDFETWIQANIDPSLSRGPWISQVIFAQTATVEALNKARTQAPPEED